MGDGLEGVWKSVKEAITGLPPMPEMQPGCDGWAKLPKKTQPDGMTWYWITDKPGSKEGNWHSEPLVKIWFYEHQIRVIDQKLLKVDLKIRPYELEIEKIEEYLEGKGAGELGEEIREASLRKRIETMVAELKNLQANGLLPTDVDHHNMVALINNLRQQLSKKTPQTENISHIVDWPVVPGGPKVPQQDLYVLMSNHRAMIDKIKRTERKPLEVQRDRNDAYLHHWQAVHDDKK